MFLRTYTSQKMSCRKGNNEKKQQKYQNKTAFRNDLHETNKKQIQINNLLVSGVCARCRDIIEWRKKFKKYKPLKSPKTCVKCQQKAVIRAYHTICSKCAQQAALCEKCGNKEDVVTEVESSPAERAREDSELRQEIGMMTERQRRTYFRHLEKGGDSGIVSPTSTSGAFCENEEIDSDDEDDNFTSEDNLCENEQCCENVTKKENKHLIVS